MTSSIQSIPLTHASFDHACLNLSRFMLFKAAEVAKAVGFSYRECHDSTCPSSLRAINVDWSISQRYGLPFPISDAGNDSSIYGHASNLAFRFWHDSIHHSFQLSTRLEDEIRVSEIQAKAVAKRFGSSSLEARIIRADVAGQARYYAQTGHFVEDQYKFVWAQLQAGVY